MSPTESLYDNYEQQYQLITSPERITSILRPLIDEHSLLSISLKNCSDIYSSVLLESNADNAELVIDGLHPDPGNTTLSETKHAMVDARVNGVDVKFQIKLIRSHSVDSATSHVFIFPDSIRYRQRRESYRAQVSPSYELEVKLQAEDGALCNGLLYDISAGGLCIHFPKQATLQDKFLKNEIHCSVWLPEKKRIRCRFMVTHAITHETSGNFQVGGRFLDLGKAQHRAIERFVAKLQRERRQNTNR